LAEAEVGGPTWAFGRHAYRFLADGRIVAMVSRHGITQTYILNPSNGSATIVALDSADVTDILPVEQRLYIAHLPSVRPAELVRTDTSATEPVVIRKSKDDRLAVEWIPDHQQVNFQTAGGATAYGIYYPPTNPNVSAPIEGAPPLLVFIHGGPTGASTPAYSQSKAYWTSRGFAILDVNYRGSTGYGRGYRQSLYGNWGVADVEDAVAGAEWAADQGLADPERLIIRGGSAGGYTTLAAHAFHNTFAVGASYFGISDFEALAKDAHKFESRYLDHLIGPYPEQKDVYRSRSPIHHLEGFTAPLLLLQGLDDEIVPPNQSEMIFNALKSRGVPTAYLAFAGEGHGFRQSKNKIRALEAEYYFYAKVLGIEGAEQIEPIEIVGLDSL
jgi:dipeptidyl aminopeptidase/acylaminoacyl peptidase